MRVWLADIDVPGLAMSRSIGDDVSHKVGVVNIPEIIECVPSCRPRPCCSIDFYVSNLISNSGCCKCI
jgi:hypothetical protein